MAPKKKMFLDVLRSMFRSRAVYALMGLMLVSAAVHIVILFVYAIMNRDAVAVNLFNILDLDLFFPNVIYGTLSQVLSLVAAIAVFLFFYFRYEKRS